MCISKAGLFLQIFDQIIDQGINKVGIQRVAVRCGIFRNACINIFRHCFIIFTLCDMTVLLHVFKASLHSLTVLFRMSCRVIAGRVLRNSSDHGTLCSGQLAQITVEIVFSSHLNTIVTSTKVDGVQIVDQDLILAHLLFQTKCQDLLLDLTSDQRTFAPLKSTGLKHVVLDQLLRDRRTALCRPLCKSLISCTADTL